MIRRREWCKKSFIVVAVLLLMVATACKTVSVPSESTSTGPQASMPSTPSTAMGTTALPPIDEPYSYPNVYHQEIPEELLARMTTHALMKTCINYPKYQNIFSYNFIYGAMQNIVESFNGFSELYARDDAVELLSNFYTQTDWVSYLQDDPFPGWHLTWFEYILAEERLIKALNEEQKENILSTALKLLADDAMKEKFAGSERSKILLIGKVLLTYDTYRAAIEQFDNELPDWLREGELSLDFNNRASFLMNLACEEVDGTSSR